MAMYIDTDDGGDDQVAIRVVRRRHSSVTTPASVVRITGSTSVSAPWTGQARSADNVSISLSAIYSALDVMNMRPRAGSGVVRMDPLRFLAGCRTRRLSQA